MAKTVISIKVDSDIRDKARKLAREIGLPLSTLVNAQLRQFVRDKTVSISAGPPRRMSKKLERLLSLVENDVKANRNMSPRFSSAKDMDRYLTP